MNDVITYSGWACTIITTVIAIKQSLLKKQYKKEVNNYKEKVSNTTNNNNFTANTHDESTVNQAGKIKIINK